MIFGEPRHFTLMVNDENDGRLVMELDIREIQKIIPHRFPFLMIDRVVDLRPNEKLTAIKNVSVNEHFFIGHFPEEKVMPGV